MASHKFECIVKRKLAHCSIVLVLTACCIVYSALVIWPEMIRVVEHSTLHRVADRNQNEFTYTRNSRVIFVGGVPRSGTTLMRALLDAHPDIRCGEETHIIPEILRIQSHWMNNRQLKDRLLEAGINMEVLDEAVAAFLLEIMAKHGEPAKRICNKDPFTLLSLSYLHSVFQNSKFLLMIRDGRAVAHSIISRRVGIAGYNISDYRDCLTRWNGATEKMYKQCLFHGPMVCLPVYYEQLVLQTEKWMQHILDFLDVPWNDAVLHHEKAVGKPGGISLSTKERSTDQVVKPINTEALTKWVGHIPADILADVDSIAPMLSQLGYDPHAPFPNYTQTSQQLGTVHKNRRLLEVELNAYGAENMWEEIQLINLKKLQQEQDRQGMVPRKVPISNAYAQY